jgi:hypothetical protein
VLLESLPTLGVVDVGGADMEAASGSGEFNGLALRLTSRGRELIGAAGRTMKPPEPSTLVEPRLLRVGGGARVADLLELGAFCDLSAVDNVLELAISPAAVSRGLAAGISAADMRAHLESVVELSEELAGALDEAGTVVGRGSLAPASAFLWIEDPEVREMLRTMQPVSDLFVDPSPPTGLLVAFGVDPERLIRRCRALGVEITIEESLLRVRHSSMPPPKKSETNRRRISWRPTPARGGKKTNGL